jgi:molybdopterin/thiamine biosynthesis adenylyltransferase
MALRREDAWVLMIGCGRLLSLWLQLAVLSGLRRFVVVDPQPLVAENRPAWLLARPEDDGRFKVDVVAEHARTHWPDVDILPFAAPAEAVASAVLTCVPRIASIVVGSNTGASRRAAALAGLAAGVPVVGLGVQDGRMAWQGLVSRWIPGEPDRACPSCFVPDGTATVDSEATLPGPMLALTASVGVRVVTDTVLGDAPATLMDNFWLIDGAALTVSTFVMQRRADCADCRPALVGPDGRWL